MSKDERYVPLAALAKEAVRSGKIEPDYLFRAECAVAMVLAEVLGKDEKAMIDRFGDIGMADIISLDTLIKLLGGMEEAVNQLRKKPELFEDLPSDEAPPPGTVIQ
jgi:hypothetical protein